MVFWNSFIRYNLLNTLKFNLSALLAFEAINGGVKELISAIVGITFLTTLPFLYACLLYKKRNELVEDSRNFAKYGALYAEVRVNMPDLGE